MLFEDATNLHTIALIQLMTYIRAYFNYKSEIVSPTSEKVTKFEISIQNAMTGHNKVRHYLVLLIVHCIEPIPKARIFIQIHKYITGNSRQETYFDKNPFITKHAKNPVTNH